MNREIAMQWADALESGKYQQTRRRLRGDDGGFCCLGVLCDLHEKATKAEGWKRITDAMTPWEYFGLNGMPPREVGVWAGARTGMIILAEQNDAGATFGEIAELVRRDWELL